MVYALHYAHLFYTSDDGGKDLAGLIFPGDRPSPTMAISSISAFTLGVALQTSDVAITSPAHPAGRDRPLHRRRSSTIWCVLALAVSVLASR